jgi:hypothetical protein
MAVILNPARAVRATALSKIVLYFGLHVLISFPPGAGRTTKPLIVATARDLQEPTHATDAELRVLLVYPGVLYGSCCAKYAAAFFKMSRSSFKRAFSFRRRFSSSYRCSSWTCCS